MTAPLTLTWDDDGNPRARLPASRRLLGRFLESEIQGSRERARQILATLDRVAAGDRETWTETGNAHTLTVSARQARIEPELDEHAVPLDLPLAELREAVVAWLAHLERGPRR
jgi:hypothetical protein